MTYSLHTLTAAREEAAAASRPVWSRYASELALLLGLAVLALWLLALLSHTPQDAAWSTSGTGGAIRNRAGQLGAWLSDLSYVLLGFSVWWCVAVAMRRWLLALSRWLRGGELEAGPDGAGGWGAWGGAGAADGVRWPQRLAFWGGLALLMVASASLEWTRLYTWEPRLPGHGGGVLGYWVGPLSARWLGDAGSALVAIVGVLIGASLAFGFSWARVAERLGAWMSSWLETRRERRELAEDRAIGQQAARERSVELPEDLPDADGQTAETVLPDGPAPVAAAPRSVRTRSSAAPAALAPVLLEPVAAAEPSERVARERQKPLFSDLPDSKLPQVDLLDGAQARQETVAPETLEMTSRLIEKKLKDFGVEVRVVAASPGPVITRYEIEPATGVKGAQIVNLAKDLARSLSLVSIRVVEVIPGKNYMALELPN
ncbi:MAG: DNA translocase FtsK, partial [Rhodoferax sp.]|nr:DNA translocase FtsK [Rhodoferax sp.]